MSQDAMNRAASLIKRETGSAIESTQIVEQLPTDTENALVIAVNTSKGEYWVVTGGRGPSLYHRDQHSSANEVLLEYVASESR